MVKNLAKIVIPLSVAILLLLAWAPWLTEEYGKEKVFNYFNQSYGIDKSDIRIGSVDKKPFEIDFGLYLSPSNKSLPETSIHAWVTFYGEVKHEILSAPWFTEENVKEKLREYFSKKGSEKADIIVESIGMSPFEATISFTFPRPQNYSQEHIYSQVYGHALVTVYGEVKEVKLIALT
jgi:hypothetical protein